MDKRIFIVGWIDRQIYRYIDIWIDRCIERLIKWID